MNDSGDEDDFAERKADRESRELQAKLALSAELEILRQWAEYGAEEEDAARRLPKDHPMKRAFRRLRDWKMGRWP